MLGDFLNSPMAAQLVWAPLIGIVWVALRPWVSRAISVSEAVVGQQATARLYSSIDNVMDRALDMALGQNVNNPARAAADYVWDALGAKIEAELGGSYTELKGRVESRMHQRNHDPQDGFNLPPLDASGNVIREQAEVAAQQAAVDALAERRPVETPLGPAITTGGIT